MKPKRTPRPALPPPGLRPKLRRDQLRDLALCHIQALDSIARGDATSATLWQVAEAALAWSRAAELMRVGEAEMTAQLELALNPGLGVFAGAGDFTLKIQSIGGAAGQSGEVEELFSLADLDQKPRPLFRPSQPAATIFLSSGQGRYFVSEKPSYSTFMMERQVSSPMKSASCSGPIG